VEGDVKLDLDRNNEKGKIKRSHDKRYNEGRELPAGWVQHKFTLIKQNKNTIKFTKPTQSRVNQLYRLDANQRNPGHNTSGNE